MRLVLLLVFGLIPGAGGAVEPQEAVVSFLGEPLRPVELPEKIRTEYETRLAAAREEYEADPDSVETTIWLGRRLAYLGRYREAIDTLSRGMDRHPDEPRLYRHRGHRFITIRQLGRALADLETAAALIEGTPDQIEPDGLPNAAGIPTSTLQSNIWYHLGLARYLQGDFQGALAAYERCLAVSKTPDMLVATSHWLYMTLRRSNLGSRAAQILEPITDDLEILENHEYHRLLLMYRGKTLPAEFWPPSADGVSSATVGYGVGNWHFYNGRTEVAKEVFERILAGKQWAAFGYIAAEAEIARWQGRDLP